MGIDKVDQKYVERIKSGKESLEEVLQELMDDGADVDFVDSLGPLCEMAGWPNEDSDPEYSVTAAKITGDTVVFTCQVFFDEKYHGSGCPDMPSFESREGEVEYELDLKTGVLSTIRRPA